MYLSAIVTNKIKIYNLKLVLCFYIFSSIKSLYTWKYWKSVRDVWHMKQLLSAWPLLLVVAVAIVVVVITVVVVIIVTLLIVFHYCIVLFHLHSGLWGTKGRDHKLHFMVRTWRVERVSSFPRPYSLKLPYLGVEPRSSNSESMG